MNAALLLHSLSPLHMQATEREREPYRQTAGAAMLSRSDLRGWPAGDRAAPAVEKHTRSASKRRAIFHKDDHNPALASREAHARTRPRAIISWVTISTDHLS